MATTIISDNGLNPIGTNTDGVIYFPGLTGSGGGISIGGIVGSSNPNLVLFMDENNTLSQGDINCNINVNKSISNININSLTFSVTSDHFNFDSNFAFTVGTNGGAIMQIAPSTQQVIFNVGTNGFLVNDLSGSSALDVQTDGYLVKIGDVDSNANDTLFTIDDPNRVISASASIINYINVGTFSMNGNTGFSGTYSTLDSQVVTVLNGIIIGVA